MLKEGTGVHRNLRDNRHFFDPLQASYTFFFSHVSLSSHPVFRNLYPVETVLYL